MVRIQVAQPDGEVVHFDGDKSTTYKVEGGYITVDELHAESILGVDGHAPAAEPKPKPGKE
jgi:hypothetical protein